MGREAAKMDMLAILEEIWMLKKPGAATNYLIAFGTPAGHIGESPRESRIRKEDEDKAVKRKLLV
jgi:hypothetical protein